MTGACTPFAATLSSDAALAHLGAAADRFSVTLTGDLGSPVPSCPGWNLRALAAHLGGIHRWARSALTQPKPGRQSDDGPEPGVDLGAWFDEGARQLIDTLRHTDPAASCWTFGPPPRTAAFWFRRQANETAMHAWDAQRTIGGAATPFPPDLALDGVDEVVTMFVPRQIRRGRLSPPTQAVELRATDADGGLTWRLGQDEREPDAVLAARAETLLLLLWRRLRIDTADVAISGDAVAVDTMLAAPLTP